VGSIQAIEKEPQDAQREIDFQVESPIDEFEIARPAPVEHIHLAKEDFQVEGPGRLVQRTQAELALERTTARGFDIEQTVRQIGIGIFAIRHYKAIQRRLFADDHLAQGPRPVQQGTAQPGKADVAPAGNHMVGQSGDFLFRDLMTDLRTTQDHPDIGPLCLE